MGYQPITTGSDIEDTNMITEFIVTEGETRKRLDQFLVNRERDISHSC